MLPMQLDPTDKPNPPETIDLRFESVADMVVVVICTSPSAGRRTIMPRVKAPGMVTMLPGGDQTSQSRKEMLALWTCAWEDGWPKN